jgi:alpha-L-fucosidase
MKTKLLLISLLIFGVVSLSDAQTDQKKPIGNERKIEEWKDARFGMFIHWGPVSLKGTEIGWSRGREIPVEEYDNLYKQFDAKNFNADDWVSVAKAAGMKYIILTTKHHDGFCPTD